MIRRSHFGDLARGAGTFGFRHGFGELLYGTTVYRNGNREHCGHAKEHTQHLKSLGGLEHSSVECCFGIYNLVLTIHAVYW